MQDSSDEDDLPYVIVSVSGRRGRVYGGGYFMFCVEDDEVAVFHSVVEDDCVSRRMTIYKLDELDNAESVVERRRLLEDEDVYDD